MSKYQGKRWPQLSTLASYPLVLISWAVDGWSVLTPYPLPIC